jgi:hypothetical protein
MLIFLLVSYYCCFCNCFQKSANLQISEIEKKDLAPGGDGGVRKKRYMKRELTRACIFWKPHESSKCDLKREMRGGGGGRGRSGIRKQSVS